jgi:hypothetical protein
VADSPGVDLRVTYRDVRRVQELLREQAPDLRRRMDREVRKLLSPIIGRAKNLVPDVALSRWHREDRRGPSRLPGFDANAARRGLKVSTGGTIRVRSAEGRLKGRSLLAYSLVQSDAGGAVFEVAGRKNPTKSAFNRNMMSRHGKASRALWRAWDTSGAHDRVLAEILGTVQATMNEYNRRLQGN